MSKDNLEEVPQDKEEEIDFEWEELLGINDDYEYPKSTSRHEESAEMPLIQNDTFEEKILKYVSSKEKVISIKIKNNKLFFIFFK